MLSNLGPMRLFLIAIAVILSFGSLFTESLRASDDKAVLYVMGAMVPIMLFVILFDVMMNRIQIADKKGHPDLQRKYRINGRIELLVTTIMVLAWLPFFGSLIG